MCRAMASVEDGRAVVDLETFVADTERRRFILAS